MGSRNERRSGVPDIVNVAEAAALVSEMMLPRRDAAGNFYRPRHPVNVYRVLRRARVPELPTRIELGATA